jgi:hypothetical protein
MRRAWPLAALAIVALIGLIGAGCGSDAPSETGAASSTGTAGSTGTTSGGADEKPTARDKAVKFAECIRAHGVRDFPDPDAKNQFQYGVSVSPAVWTKAVSACKDLQPPGTLSGKRTPRQQSTALKFAQCMRDNGVKDFPDPANGDPLIDTTKIPSLGDRSPRTDPVFAPAMDKCRAVLAAALRDQK